LAGCGNAVTSTKPLFTIKDARGQAQPRPGVWGYSNSTKLPTCKVDTSQPVGTWDDCAGGVVLRPGELYSVQGADHHLRLDDRFVLARGSPAVLQGIDLVSDFKPQPADYEFAGAQPTKFDSRGRVVELRLWQAMCGQPPTRGPNDVGYKLAVRLLPGLTADSNHVDCVAAAQGPVRASVKASWDWAVQSGGGTPVMYLQWFRDGDR
jgi:hypothetical protein